MLRSLLLAAFQRLFDGPPCVFFMTSHGSMAVGGLLIHKWLFDGFRMLWVVCMMVYDGFCDPKAS